MCLYGDLESVRLGGTWLVVFSEYKLFFALT